MSNPNDQQASPPNLIHKAIDKGPFGFQQILVVGLCMLFNILDGFDITAMAVSASALGQELALPADKLGIAFSFSLAGMMVGAIFLASLADIFGRRTIIIVTLLLMGFSVLGTAYVHSLWPLAFLRFISGLGAGAMLASQATLASEYSPEKYRALSVTIVTCGFPLGAMLTGVIAEAVIPAFGWRGMFIGGGIATLFLAFVALCLLPESLQFLCTSKPKNALEKLNRILKRLKIEAVSEIPEVKSANQENANKQSIFSNISGLLRSDLRKITLILWGAYFSSLLTMYFLLSWMPKLVADAGFSAQAGNYAFSMFNFGGVIGIFGLGYLSTKLSLSNMICSFLCGSAALMCTVALAATEFQLLALIFVTGILLNGGFCGLYAAATKIYPTEIRSTGVGAAIGLGRFGAVIAPAAGGWMIASGLDLSATFILFSVPIFMGGVFAFCLRVR